jgi:hypothetical protein
MNSNANGNANRSLNWPTVVLVLLSGGANIFVVERGNIGIASNREEIDRSLRQIRELHDGDQVAPGPNCVAKRSLNARCHAS